MGPKDQAKPTKVRLSYFNFRGRAEVIRWILAVGDIEYEDIRYDWDTWKGEKSEKESLLPFNQLPTLEIDGQLFCQTKAICRYLADLVGLLGDTALDRFRCDMFVECVDDVVNAVIKMRNEPNEARKQELLDSLASETFPRAMRTFDKFLADRERAGPYYLGDKLTWADVYFVATLFNVNVYMEDFHKVPMGFDKYPSLVMYFEAVQSVPRIQAWIKKRPVTRR